MFFFSQGIKSLVHDVQLKRQKEIRDMMKKKREKAVLVDRVRTHFNCT